jgi:hypothetical protein
MRKLRYVRPVALVLSLAFSGGAVAAKDPAASMIGQPAPSFRLTDVLSGKTVSLEDLRGKTIVLHFGASW